MSSGSYVDLSSGIVTTGLTGDPVASSRPMPSQDLLDGATAVGIWLMPSPPQRAAGLAGRGARQAAAGVSRCPALRGAVRAVPRAGPTGRRRAGRALPR